MDKFNLDQSLRRTGTEREREKVIKDTPDLFTSDTVLAVAQTQEFEKAMSLGCPRRVGHGQVRYTHKTQHEEPLHVRAIQEHSGDAAQPNFFTRKVFEDSYAKKIYHIGTFFVFEKIITRGGPVHGGFMQTQSSTSNAFTPPSSTRWTILPIQQFRLPST